MFVAAVRFVAEDPAIADDRCRVSVDADAPSLPGGVYAAEGYVVSNTAVLNDG